MSEGYVVLTPEYGYYDGKILFAEGIYFLAHILFKDHDRVKVYKTEQGAIRAGEKIKKKCKYVDDYKILPR